MRIDPFLAPFDVELTMPGAKSHANRALITACLADGETVVECPQPADDVRWMVRGLAALGYAIHWCGPQRVHIEGGIPESAPDDAVRIDCDAAGTVLRFLCGVAAITPGEWILTGTARLRERPIGALTAALRQLGVEASDTAGCPPVRIKGRPLRGGGITLDAAQSSQFLSALLLVAPTMRQGLTVDLPSPPTSEPYVAMTGGVLAEFGATLRIAPERTRFQVAPGALNAPGRCMIEGDWSAAGVWLVLERLLGGRFGATNLIAGSLQGDAALPRYLDQLDRPGPTRIDVSSIPDQTMNLAVRAAFRTESTEFFGAANLRRKECDRLATTVAGLQAFGVTARETADGLVVERGPPARHAAAPIRDDHRMAMAWAALGVAAAGAEIDAPDCVAKSYPRFFDDLAAARRTTRPIAVVGMRAAGKSTFVRALAPELGLTAVDTDREFEAEHGPIDAFVAAHGWPAFRSLEAGVVARVLRPGRLIALGGGAIESEAVAVRLRDRALVVWLVETPETIEARLARRGRPSLTGRDPVDEVREVLCRRTPRWAAVADLVLAPGGSQRARIEAVRTWLARRPFRSERAAGPAID